MASLFALGITACTSGGNSPPPPPPPPPVNNEALPITAENVEYITASVMAIATDLVNLMNYVDVIGLPVREVGSPGAPIIPRTPLVSGTVNCDTGSFTLTWMDPDLNLLLSNGDSVDVDFDMCVDAGEGVTVDGATSLTNIVITGDPVGQVAPWSLAATYGFTGLSVSGNAGTSSVDGDVSFSLSSDDNILFELTAGSTTLQTTRPDRTESISGYQLAYSLDLNTLIQTLSTGGSYANNVLAGTVSFQTLQDIVINGDLTPAQGQLQMNDGSSSAIVTVLDAINAQLELDLDFDGTIDETIVVPWIAIFLL